MISPPPMILAVLYRTYQTCCKMKNVRRNKIQNYKINNCRVKYPANAYVCARKYEKTRRSLQSNPEGRYIWISWRKIVFYFFLCVAEAKL